MDSTRNAPAPRRRSVLRKVLIGLAALAGLLVLAVVGLLLLVDSDAVAARVTDRVLPQLSEKIGREVTVEDVSVSVLPVPRVRLERLQVQGVSERPLVRAEEALARLDVWSLITSLGREVRLESVDLHDTELNVVRLADGTWGFRQILDRLEASETGADRKVAIDRVTIRNGTVRMIDRSAPGGVATAELQGVEATARHVEQGEPMTLELKAALQSQTPNLEAQLQIDPLPMDFAALGPGNWPEVTGSIEVRDAPIGALRNLLPAGLDQVTTGGLVRISGEISTENERYLAAGSGAINGLQLRGEPAEASFSYASQLDPATKVAQLSLQDLDVAGPGIELGGTAQVSTQPVRFEFALAGPLLDLDTLLGVLPVRAEEQAREDSAAGPVIPPAARASLKSASGSGTLAIDRLVSGKLTATDVQTRARLEGGVLTLDEAQAGFYGGVVRAGGTTANLTEEVPSWHLDAEMEGVELEEAMGAIAGFAPMRGTLVSDVDLRGAGVDWQVLRDAITGAALIQLNEGQLRTLNLDQAIAGSLAQGLRALGQRVTAGRVEEGVAATTLRDLRTRVRVEDGWMVLQQPITVRSAFGTVRLDGRIGLDWALDLQGTAQLAPDFVAQVTGGSFRPSQPVELPMQLGGTLRDPAVGAFDTEAIARSLLPTGQVERRVQKEVESAQERARREAQRRARDILPF